MPRNCTGRKPTRTAETEAEYAQRYDALRLMAEREERAGTDIIEVVDWFCRQHARWSDSTIRKYRASLKFMLGTDRLDPDRQTLLECNLSKHPSPLVGGPKRTSAKKRKSLPQEEYLQLVTFLQSSAKADDLLILGILKVGVALFPRPSELANARVVDTTFIVRNAKATNGRPNGATRERDLLPMHPNGIRSLESFLENLQGEARRAGGWKRLHDRLSSRLARICVRELGIRRLCFYTLRHQGMATAKIWMTPVEVAAAAGHASVATATSHYAKKRTGWVGLRLAGLPSKASIERVQGQAKFFSPDIPKPRL